MTTTLPRDVKDLSWAAEQLGIGVSTAYRLVAVGKIPGPLRIGTQWRVSVPRILAQNPWGRAGQRPAMTGSPRSPLGREGAASGRGQRPGPRLALRGHANARRR
jgi:excisionase family DNA binding protein